MEERSKDIDSGCLSGAFEKFDDAGDLRFPFSNIYMKCSATGEPNAHTPVREKNKTSCDNRHQTSDQNVDGSV
jgi:hypothetical protein